MQGRESLRSRNVGKSCFYCLKNSHRIKLAMRKSPVRTSADITLYQHYSIPTKRFGANHISDMTKVITVPVESIGVSQVRRGEARGEETVRRIL